MATRAAESSKAVPLFGRAEIFDELVHQLEEARGGEGRAAILVGPAGIGKSTLLRASTSLARDLGYSVRLGRALPADPPLPFGLIRDLLREPESAPRTKRTEEVPSGLPLFLAPHEGGMLAEAVFQPEGSETGAAPDRLLAHLARSTERVDSNRSALFIQISDYFLQLGRDQPLLLAVDDLQFADESSLAFLIQFLKLLPESRVVVLATSPPVSECPPRTPEQLEQFLSDPHVHSLKVRPMTETELGQYVRWLLRGKDPGRDALMRWFTQTDGNPLFTEHLVRASTGLVPTPPAEPRSQDFLEVLHTRLQNLGEPEKRVIAYAAVLGKEFDFSTLVRASGQDEESLSESLDKLVHGGILREKPGEIYEFVSERVRSDVYAQLTETRRRILHRRAAEALLAAAPDRPVSVYELARQFYLGRDDPNAVEYNQRAAELAAQAYAFDVAVVHAERALECQRRIEPRDVALELRLMVQMGRFLDESGEIPRSEELLVDAVARARAQTGAEAELALALLGLARTRSDLGQFHSARELAAEAYPILERLGNRRGLLTAHQLLGLSSWRLADIPEAEKHLRAEIELAGTVGSVAEQGHAFIDLANALAQQGEGRLGEALELYDQALQLLLTDNDLTARARVLMNRAILLHGGGQRPRALQEMVEALETAEKSRSRIWIGYCSLNMSQFYAELPDLPKARAAIERAEALLAPLGDQLGAQQAHMIRGMIHTAAGDYAPAEEEYAAALALAEELELSSMTAEMKYRLANLARLRGNSAEARRLLKEAEQAGVLTLRGDLTNEVRDLERQLAAST